MDARLGDFKLADPDRDDIEEYLEKPLPDNWETMSQKDRDEFEDGYLIVDERKLTGKRQTVTLKEIRLNVFGDSPKRAAGPGRTSTACRIVSIMDNMPGWECVGNIHTIKDGVHSRSKTWRRVEEEK
jgi:hypothetical protein